MSASSKKVILAALVGNTLVALTKFAAAAVTGSSAMLAEGVHSLVDTGNQILLLIGLRKAQKKADAKFPFGYGKEVYFWSFVVAILIFAVGSGVSIYEGIHQLVFPSPIKNPLVNYVVLLLALLFEGAALYFALTEFTRAKGKWGYFEAVCKGKDPTLFVVLFEDSAAMLGLLVAFFGVLLTHLTGNLFFDGAASILIGFILGGTAIWLAYETKGLLIGESADPRAVNAIRSLLEATPEIEHVNEVLTLHMGPEYILVNLSVDFADRLSALDIETCIKRLDLEIKSNNPIVKRVFIEAESRTKQIQR
ncbi:MAG: cation transporter [Deltaproteobacteria bacterium]|jgi:cation diffusion facilitator family transporter|nr:cation transporter [Deltaproteobacteria bacterium]MBW2477725.1 cation transporter [Deltaproteobacteria bacterium]MBW2520205.1 cation transporter [Deltaproteobacteria bacterium]